MCTVDLRGYKRYEGVLAQAVERSPRGSSASAQCAGRSNFRCCALVDHGRFGPSVAADVTDRCETGARSRRERGPNDGSLSYQVDLSANGNRLRFFRTQGTITMDWPLYPKSLLMKVAAPFMGGAMRKATREELELLKEHVERP